ncbi:MAG: helix-turn-helix domain-containing protein [Treponema sp.]|nr:helix-turn-helix domain-containing protein [Treponema sp.]
MVILVLSQSMEHSLRICSRLEEELHICAPVEDVSKLSEILENKGQSSIDLLICDYFVFASSSHNPYESMREFLKREKLPFIFYNDPLLPETEKYSYWEDSILKYCPYSSTLDLAGVYRPFFMWMNINAGMEKLFREETDGKKKDLKDAGHDLFMMAREMGVSDSRLRLLQYFIGNQGRSLLFADICRDVWKREDESALQMLYTYVSNLRQAFHNCMEYDMKIIRSGKNKYIFSMDKRKLLPDGFNVREFLALPAGYKINF